MAIGGFDAIADTTVSTDTTQNVGTFAVDPPVLLVTDDSNDPTLTLTNGASASWEGATIIGNLNGESGNLELLNGSTLSNSGTTAIGTYGSLTVYSGRGYLGLNSGSQGTALVSGAGSTWTNGPELSIGFSGSGELTIENGGAVSNVNNGYIGYYSTGQGTVNVTGAGSTWTNGSSLIVGLTGSGELTIEDGGSVSNSDGYIGSSSDAEGTVTVTGAGSTWTNTGTFNVGRAGSGELIIEDGGAVFNSNGIIGNTSAGQGTVSVSGMSTIWSNSNYLTIGNSGSNNTLTVADGALVTVDGTLVISYDSGAEFNYLRLNEGFFAWEGDNLDAVEDFLFAGEILVWDAEAEAWIDANSTLGQTLFEYAYFETNEAAFAYTGYEGLGGYTILTSAVPEPEQFAALAGLLGLLLAVRRRK